MKTLFKITGVVLLAAVIFAGGFIGWLTLTEYSPGDTETLSVSGSASASPSAGGGVSILSFNAGYCALGAESDFFLDGGEDVRPDSSDYVRECLDGISAIVSGSGANVVLLQEVDSSAKRSYHTNEASALSSVFGGSAAFALNYSCPYIPYPLPTLGDVESGLLTLSSFGVASAERRALPLSFSWPVRLAQLKRCLLIERIPVEGSENELVIINLHLEAYDNGEGRLAQTALLLEILEDEYAKGNWCIAGGDFNQTFPGVDPAAYPIVDSSYYAPLVMSEELLPEGWSWAFDDSVPTCRLLNQPYAPGTPGTQYYVIDGFILSPNVSLDSVSTLDMDFLYSDHNPVLLRAVLN